MMVILTAFFTPHKLFLFNCALICGQVIVKRLINIMMSGKKKRGQGQLAGIMRLVNESLAFSDENLDIL